MDNEEESELAGGFGRVFRQAMGSGMQFSETRFRFSQERERQAQAARRDQVGQLGMAMKLEMQDPEFMRKHDGRQIAEAMRVSGQLAPTNRDAHDAFFHGTDELRKMNINYADLNRDHPGAPHEADRALAKQIDDFRQAQREQAQAEDARREREVHQRIAESEGIDVKDVPAFLERQEAQARGMEVDRPDVAAEFNPNAEALDQSAASHRADAAADGQEHDLRQGEDRLDIATADRERSQAETGGRDSEAAPRVGHPVAVAANSYERFPQGDRARVGANAPELALSRSRQAAGFPRSTKANVGQGLKPSRPARGAGQSAGQSKANQAEVTR